MSLPCELPELRGHPFIALQRAQRTLRAPVMATGVGVFSGDRVSIRICPAEADSGIVFQRTDLAHRPRLPARLESVQGTPRCTVIGNGKDFVQTVEHLLAALSAYGVDNALIEISGKEVPIFDGSSSSFVNLIEEGGICHLKAKRPVYSLRAPVFWSQGDSHLVALPADEYRISYTLHYPRSKTIGTQFFSIGVDRHSFKREVAPCRTFSVYEEIAPMIEKGLIKGGSLENAILVKEERVVNPEGLRFEDEMVRHKLLDLIGDLSLVPVPFLAHVIAVCSGHASNVAFANELFNHIKMENM